MYAVVKPICVTAWITTQKPLLTDRQPVTLIFVPIFLPCAETFQFDQYRQWKGIVGM